MIWFLVLLLAILIITIIGFTIDDNKKWKIEQRETEMKKFREREKEQKAKAEKELHVLKRKYGLEPPLQTQQKSKKKDPV